MEMTFDEAVSELENGIGVTLETDDNYYTIGPAEDFVGGDGQEGYYISEVLGNILYDNAEQILIESISYLEKQNEGEVVILEG